MLVLCVLRVLSHFHICFCIGSDCSVAEVVWNEGRVLDPSLFLIWHMQTRFVGFVGGKQQNILWRYAFLAIIWLLWLERNDRIFHEKTTEALDLWKQFVFLASLWAFASGAFLLIVWCYSRLECVSVTCDFGEDILSSANLVIIILINKIVFYPKIKLMNQMTATNPLNMLQKP